MQVSIPATTLLSDKRGKMNDISLDDVRGAVARGWCTKENEKKEMDVVLALAIADEVYKLLGGGGSDDK